MSFMEEKTNISILLKDCPSGMELNCMMFDDLYFDFIDVKNELIHCYIQSIDYKTSIIFDKYGCYVSKEQSKCVIFPKGKMTWENFQRPFINGDVVVYNNSCFGEYVFIYKKREDGYLVIQHCGMYKSRSVVDFNPYTLVGVHDDLRFATDSEKNSLFYKLNQIGYEWDEKTKTLKKPFDPIFKIGDRIRLKNDSASNSPIILIETLSNDGYYGKISNTETHIPFKIQNEYKLVIGKFDPNTFKPFDKVLVRNNSLENWRIQFFENYDRQYGAKYPFDCMCGKFSQCIPYKNNELLRNTAYDCDNFYKSWE